MNEPSVDIKIADAGITTADQDAKNIAVLTWVGTIFFGFIPSLIVYLVKQDDAYVKDQSKEALNWSITVFIAMFGAGILSMVLIGLLLIPIIMLCSLIFCIMGAVSCSSGKAFRVPFALRLIK